MVIFIITTPTVPAAVVVLALEVVVEDIVAVITDGGDVEVSENVKNMILPI